MERWKVVVVVLLTSTSTTFIKTLTTITEMPYPRASDESVGVQKTTNANIVMRMPGKIVNIS